MGMGIGGKRGKRAMVADINVTPLVDVMLVLLIIFMITAPMMTQGVDVDLPETTTTPLRQKEDPIVVAIQKDGTIYLNKTQVDESLLHQQLTALAEKDTEKPVYLKADKVVPYGLVVSVMAVIKDSGFEKLGMITQPVDKNPEE